MPVMSRIAGAGLGAALIVAAVPAAAQFYPRYGVDTRFAARQCAAAVDRRSNLRVVSVTRVEPRRNSIRVRGIAVRERFAYGPYGAGAYGAVGYSYRNRANVTFRCDVDYRGRIRDIDINRR